MRPATLALVVVLLLVFGLPLLAVGWRWWETHNGVVEVHARMPEAGGWSPSDLSVPAGETLQLRLISDDVLHGFAIGQDSSSALDLYPGKPVETTLLFEQPGKYTYYCTRWCGPDHWRMRGTIQVTGVGQATPVEKQQPLYLSLGLDIDAPHEATRLPRQKPSALRGEALGLQLPQKYLSLDYYRVHSPEQTWIDLRGEPFTQRFDDEQVWDLVALVWRANADMKAGDKSAQFYARDCAACHGEMGAGDGVFSRLFGVHSESVDIHARQGPADFTNAARILGASPAIMHGKIVRGGMGTGMPYWGPIYTDDEIWALVDYIYSFQFDFEEK